MPLPFFNNGGRKRREQVVAVDLGHRTTKAVHLQRRDAGFALCDYALMDAPIFEKTISAELLAEHLKNLGQALQIKTKSVTLTISVSDALVRATDMPRLPVEELRSVLKLNSRAYLQQELTGYVFDGHVLASYADAGSKPGASGANSQKQNVLVAGAKNQLVTELAQGARGAGLGTDAIVPALIGPVNAFEQAMPEIFSSESVGLVDIGFNNTSICILQKGELVLSRIVGIGGNKLTAGLSETMNISYAEAEGIKIGMPTEVKPALEAVLIPLGRELRASLDFYEHQYDKMVSRVFISGGSARSQVVLETLQTELMVECKTWDPTRFLQMELPAQKAAELAEVSPQLAVAVGAALASI